MAENEKILDESASQPQLTKGQKFLAGIKEWFRKQIVGLKRKPQNVAMFFLLATSVYFMFILFNVSQAINASNADPNTPATGICMFVTTLLSLLVLVSFLNAFPKRKKPNLAFIILVFAMIAGMIATDLVYYVQMNNCMSGVANPAESAMYAAVSYAQPYIMAHIVLLIVSAVVFALLPVYSRLIRMIDTSVKVTSATENMKGEIDIED